MLTRPHVNQFGAPGSVAPLGIAQDAPGIKNKKNLVWG